MNPAEICAICKTWFFVRQNSSLREKIFKLFFYASIYEQGENGLYQGVVSSVCRRVSERVVVFLRVVYFLERGIV
ncbi:MAG: hypothetical protein A2743_01000 [Candidatus Taylorbacteria bacterium RIFCSPHIGHO2_01_FULL_43_47]|nr:MAG: hypothetical protein A2743_01000 [Candidatus Taylorbacteria bacterium RIFCSPHIGHO2_01_FULL_43_47]